MAEEKDLRIGTLDEAGEPVEWPGVSVTGARYTRPATVQKLNNSRFVVLPANFNQWELVTELKGARSRSIPAVDFADSSEDKGKRK